MFKHTFCPTPWIHMRIRSNGDFEFCRWAKKEVAEVRNIKDTSIKEYFQKHLSIVRKDLLDGKSLKECDDCYVMEKHKKISGRQKQLLKIGINEQKFKKTLNSSTFLNKFKYSNENNGDTDCLPVDWQIDLGNFCNSACVMCEPRSSSKLANEWLKLGFIDKPYNNFSWAQDSYLLSKFVEELVHIKNLQYLHFLGGETLITPGFSKILEELIKNKLNQNVIIGLTTNLTVWPEQIIELLKSFKYVHLGMSIETLDSVNDYVRWPSNITDVRNTLNRFVELGKRHNWDMSIRVTPNLLTITRLKKLYQYAYDNFIGIESCNFLYRPEFLRIDLLPGNLRQSAMDAINEFINSSTTEKIQQIPIVNVRNNATIRQAVLQDAQSVLHYLEKQPQYDKSKYTDLVTFLKKLENNRKNKILDHLPEYEEFFRSIGY